MYDYNSSMIYFDKNGTKYTHESLFKGISHHTTIETVTIGGGAGGELLGGNWDGTIVGCPSELLHYACRKALAIPSDLIPIFQKYCGGWLDWRLHAALCCVESNFNKRASNNAGAAGHFGLGQLSWQYFANKFPKGKSEEPGGVYNPDDNIRVSAQALNDIYGRVSKNTQDKQLAIFLTLSAYNSGEGGGVYKQWRSCKNLIEAYNRTGSTENKQYAPSILKIYSEYLSKY